MANKKHGPAKAAKHLNLELAECRKHLKYAIENNFRVVAETSSYFLTGTEARETGHPRLIGDF
jgi:hypothetical protein